MKLVIVHYHLRPGGIRRVIELATPQLVRRLDSTVETVVLAVGESADRKWSAAFQRRLKGVRVEFFVEPTFKYLSEQRLPVAQIQKRLRGALERLLAEGDADNTLVWAHNLAVGRNLVLARELARGCAARHVPLVSHHHDWWFDNRWRRWPEMRRCGFRTLNTVAHAMLPSSPTVRHAAINHADAVVLQRHFAGRAGWLPNLTERSQPASPASVRTTRCWLTHELADDAPVWILPCRLLRRKNVAEALLLTRWLRPGAWLVTTGGVSSPDEIPYFQKLNAAAKRHQWRLRLGVLSGDETRKPAVAELLAASEAVLLTSIQEGFGLPYLEAAAASRPLIARSLPNIAPDLEQFGFRFPQYYDEILVHTGLFDWKAERARQMRLFRAWQLRLPHAIRNIASEPAVLVARRKPEAVPFSRLTLTAQLEVLRASPELSWEACAPFNLFLRVWRQRAARGQLQVSRWPHTARRYLSGEAYAERFLSILRFQSSRHIGQRVVFEAQKEFIKKKLTAANQYPLLWQIKS